MPTSEASTTTTVKPTTTTSTVPATTTTTTIPGVPVADPPIVAVRSNDGPNTQAAQQRLVDLGFWLAAADGNYDLTTKQAVMAFQKYYGLDTDGVIGDETAAQLTAVTELPTVAPTPARWSRSTRACSCCSS